MFGGLDEIEQSFGQRLDPLSRLWLLFVGVISLQHKMALVHKRCDKLQQGTLDNTRRQNMSDIEHKDK